MLYNKIKKDISGNDNDNFSILEKSLIELDKNSKIIEDPEVVPVETLKNFLNVFKIIKIIIIKKLIKKYKY